MYMKKLFMFLVVAGLATFGVSCSKSDDSPAPAPAKELKLTANPQGEVFVGDVVNFSVSSGTEIIKDAVIMEGDKNAVKDGKWTATSEGSFKFKATKTGYNPSNEVTVVVKKKVQKVMILKASKTQVNAKENFELTVVDDKGVGIDGAELIFEGESTGYLSEEGGKWVISINGPGTYKMKAVLNGSESNEISITAVEAPLVKGVGSFKFDGKEYASEYGFTTLRGLFYADDTKTKIVTVWIEEVVAKDGSASAVIFYTTPSEKKDGKDVITLPTETNISGAYGGVLDKDGKVIGATANGAPEMKTTYKITKSTDAVFTGDFVSSNGVINGKEFSVTFKGDHNFEIEKKTAGASARLGKLSLVSMKAVKTVKQARADFSL